MFNKEKILEIINQDGLYIDNFILEAFIKNWKIDPIYEDENGTEYFDEMTVEKIKNGISQKSQPRCEIHIMDKDDVRPVEMAVEVPIDMPDEGQAENNNSEPAAFVDEQEHQEIQYSENVEVQTEHPEPVSQENPEETQSAENQPVPMDLPIEVQKEVEAELKNITVDISNQTLAVLAESIARKITSDVSEFIKKSDFIKEAVEMGELKKDNEILVGKIEELLSDNKILVQRIRELENENKGYTKIFGNFYLKND